jgi:Protein of unknown function (DUF2510)
MSNEGQAQPGWYPDPSGPPGQQRWWDGTRWTEHLQPAPGAAPEGPLPPSAGPPSAPAGSGSSNTLVVVLVVLGVLAVLGIGGCVACAALVGEGAEDIGREIEQELDRELQREFNERAITRDEFDSVERGSRREAVERRLGPPNDFTEAAGEVCLYYNRQGGELGDQYEFCFVGGRLVSKSSL